MKHDVYEIYFVYAQLGCDKRTLKSDPMIDRMTMAKRDMTMLVVEYMC